MMSSVLSRLPLTLLSMACLFFILIGQSLAAVEEEKLVGVEVLAILNTDELGAKIRYPSAVTYDKEMDEIYVIVGGEGKVIVYGSNFFPTVSLAKGRGADSPRGIYIDKSNTIYLCQSRTSKHQSRLTLFNPAFFPEKEIVFSSMPEGDLFIPQKVTTGLTGNIYVTGIDTRGVLVLDSNGEFSHWLKPMDKILTETDGEMVRDDVVKLQQEMTAVGSETVQELPDLESSTMDMRDLLPPGLLPSIDEEGTISVEPDLVPVQVADITSDSSGHLYVLSEETSKIYVYSPNEEFLFAFGEKGGSVGKMSRPKSLVVDEKKNALYVVDYMRHTVLVFDLGGKYMYEFGGMGVGPGWFQYPISLALNKKGNLIVADLFNHRVQVLAINFEYKFPLFSNPEKKQEATIPDIEEPSAPEIDGEDDSIFLPQPLYL